MSRDSLDTLIKERRFSKTFLRFGFYFEIFQLVSLVRAASPQWVVLCKVFRLSFFVDLKFLLWNAAKIVLVMYIRTNLHARLAAVNSYIQVNKK